MTTDHDLLRPVRQSLSGLQMRTPVESIIRNGRARQRRRRLAVTTVTTSAGVTAVIVGTSVAGSTAGSPRSHPARPVSSAHTQLAAFTVTSGEGGSTDLSLRKGADLDPGALRQALAQRGIPALVTVGTFCRTPSKPVDTAPLLVPEHEADGSVDLTINPAAIPTGAELSIGLDVNTVRFLLINEHAPQVCGPLVSQPAYHQPGGSEVIHSTDHP
jgi:hypothetical protein